MPNCGVCGKEVPSAEGYFTEAGKDYCEKCYADKRWAELGPADRAKWRANTIAVWNAYIMAGATPEERNARLDLVRLLKVPKALETDMEVVQCP